MHVTTWTDFSSDCTVRVPTSASSSTSGRNGMSLVTRIIRGLHGPCFTRAVSVSIWTGKRYTLTTGHKRLRGRDDWRSRRLFRGPRTLSSSTVRLERISSHSWRHLMRGSAMKQVTRMTRFSILATSHSDADSSNTRIGRATWHRFLSRRILHTTCRFH